jgi:hypothetical protein
MSSWLHWGKTRARFWFRVTLAPGHRSVAACRRALSSQEFTEWLAYSCLEPFGPEADDRRMAQLMALVANVNCDPKRRKTPWTADDFLPQRGPRPAHEVETLRRGSTSPMAALGRVRMRSAGR